jgi:lipopolysaccharide transport system permease protein
MNGAVAILPSRPMTRLLDLVIVLVIRDLKLRYKRSVLGVAWSLLNPLAYLLVLQFVFGALMPLGIPRYPSFLFSGLLAWGWFSSSLLWAAGSVADHRDLIRQPGFPAAILPPVRVLSDLIHFLLALPVLFLFLYIGGTPLTWAALTLPLLIAVQFLLTLGPAYLVAACEARYHDTHYLLTILLQLLFFLTPVFYDVATVADRYRPLYGLNPLAHLIQGYRAVLLIGRPANPESVAILIAVSAGLLVLGAGVFARMQFRFVEEA